MFFEIFTIAMYIMIGAGVYGEFSDKNGTKVTLVQAIVWPISVSSFVWYCMVKYLNGK